MGKAYITKHSVTRRNFAAMSSGEPIGALGGHEGDSIDLDFTNGLDTTEALETGLYEICISGGDARLKIHKTDSATQVNGQFWPDGRIGIRFVREDEKISIVSAD